MSFMQVIQRGQPVYEVANLRNTEASTALTVGQPVCYDYTTDADGVGVLLPTTAHLQFPAGLVESASIAAGDYGLVCTKGHFAYGACEGTTDIAVGDPLVITNGTAYLTKATLVTNAIGQFKACFVAGEAYTTAAVAAKKVWVNC
jgi:hypothetical protein